MNVIDKCKNAATAFGDSIRRGFGKAAAVGTGLVASTVSTVALATPPSLGQEAATAIGGAETEVGLVQAAVIGVLVLLVIFLFIKRSMR